MCGETYAYRHVGARVLEDQVPADDPGDEFAHGRVSVGVGRAGDGDHAGEFGVAKSSESADERDENHADGERGSGAGAAKHGGAMQQVVEHRRVQDAGGGELFTGDGGADDGENSGADDGANAERGQADGAEGLLQRVLGQLAVRDELVYIFSGE